MTDRPSSLEASDYQEIRQLLDDYLRMYASRDDRLTTFFSDDFSGFTGGGDFLVKDKAAWIAITRQDFAQIKDPIRIELKDVAIQSLADTIAVATSFFTIHLPIKDHILSRETARLVLIFRKESAGWKISHSSISIPYHLVREGEIYPLKELVDRNRFLEKQVAERTRQLSEANHNLRQTNEELASEIVKHQQAEEALRQSEVELKGILDTTADGILAIDSHGKVIRSNRRFANLWRIPPSLMNAGDDQQLLDFVLHQLAEPDAFLQKVRALYVSTEEDTGTLAFKDGRIFERCSAPLIKESSLVGRVWFFRDITERKQMESAKAKLEVQNWQLQKSESLGRMAGAIAHHFNNQLMGVMLNLELAGTKLPLNADLLENLTEAMQSARKAAEVSGLMLTYLGQTVGKPEPLDLTDACQKSLSLLRAIIPQSVVLETELPSPGPIISADTNQIQQVLTNLVTNAWEANGDRGGIVRLTVKKVSVTEIPIVNRFPIDCHPQDNAYACLEVLDAGCGIPTKDIEKIFDPFFSSKFTGRGMGLAVVLGIVRAHLGIVTVESEPKRGSVFRVFLPISMEASSRQSPQTAQASKFKGSGTLLLVEDEPVVREVVSKTLKGFGFTVLVAKDGVEAMEIFRRHRDKIRFVLCDLTMPRMNGWETLAALRQISPGIPVILSSGYSEAQVMAGDHPEQPQFFLIKPYKQNELIDAISQVLAIGKTEG